MMNKETIEGVMGHDVETPETAIFEILFNLIYKNFENCDKESLNIEYFDLYSNLLEFLNTHSSLLEKLKLNWMILTKSMIKLFQNHKSTEITLNSPTDQVAQGFLRIIKKLLNEETIKEFIPLVKFIFKENLFPEGGQHKLKNSQSRKDAYNLIYEICRHKDKDGNSSGLQ